MVAENTAGLPKDSGTEKNVELSDAGVAALAAVYSTIAQMVSPGGCSWHAAQTHASLLPFLIEESAELVDAVERGLPTEEVAGELGDVLYQVLFHALIAERDGEGYDLAAVAEQLDEKLRARHPHVFGDRGFMSVEELHAEWERLKEDAAGKQRGSRGVLEGIPVAMPTLARAAKVVERLRRAGLLVDAAPSTTANYAAQPQQSSESKSNVGAEIELGDALLALVVQANEQRIDPDAALRAATRRLTERAGQTGAS